MKKPIYDVLINKFDTDEFLDFRSILRKQTMKGLEKYGKYLFTDDKNIDENYALEELVDAAVYLQTLGYDDLVFKIVNIFNEVLNRKKERNLC